jgi:hypothetical protein
MTELGTHAGHIRVQRSAHMGCGTRQKAHVMNRIFVHARALVTLEEKLVAKFKYFHDRPCGVECQSRSQAGRAGDIPSTLPHILATAYSAAAHSEATKAGKSYKICSPIGPF